MLTLYYTTTERTLLPIDGREPICGLAAECRGRHREEAHLCFTTEPLAGQGPNVFSVEVDESVAERFEYTNPFRVGEARFVALPTALLRRLPIRETTFEAVRQRPWNQFLVPILDRRPTDDKKLLGTWRIVWMSRPGAASATTYRKSGTMYHSVLVTLAPDFDPAMDYVLVERHEEMDQTLFDRPKETWELAVLAGSAPAWQIYPQAWQDWVWDERVTDSAIRYILNLIPEARSEVQYARGKMAKHNKVRAWRNVVDAIDRTLSTRNGRPGSVSIGKFASQSWTAIAAMPTRIAARLDKYFPGVEAWVPPLPKPDYADPLRSGRVVLANLYGPNPTEGPGVDHAPQERPFLKLEGKQRDEDREPFPERQTASAPASGGLFLDVKNAVPVW
jgi:hypothetical protein